MSWWSRFRDTYAWLNAAQWPDRVAWPQGRPSQMPSFTRARMAAIAAPIVVGVIVIASGMPFALELVLFLLCGALPTIGYVIWTVVREARRQGWGSNLH